MGLLDLNLNSKLYGQTNPIHRQPAGYTPFLGVTAPGAESGNKFNWQALGKFDAEPQNGDKFDTRAAKNIEPAKLPEQLENSEKINNLYVNALGACSDDPNAKYKTALLGQNICLAA